MRKCRHCGSLIGNGYKFCEACGMPVPEEKWYMITLCFLLGFFVPLAGGVFYIIKMDDTPKAANAALIGFVLDFALLLLWFIGIPLIGMMINIG